jgi:ABC-type glycerol-3-phosphate transport system permease component
VTAQRRLQLGLSYLVVAIGLVVFLFPIVWLILGSLKPPVDVLTVSLPRKPTLVNYRAVLDSYPVARFLRNSLTVALGSTALSLTTGALAAYGFARARYRFRGRAMLFLFILMLRMLPLIAIGIPIYLLFTRIHLVDRAPGLILAHAAVQLPLVIWIVQGFVQDVPVELEEAGLIDGCSRLNVLWRIVLPLITPGLAVAAILAFLFSWNEFGLAVILVSSPDLQTMPVALAQMNLVYGIRWDVLSAAAVLYIGPTMVMALVLQRYIVRGLTMGSVKG